MLNNSPTLLVGIYLGNENICSHKDLSMNVFNSFIHKHQNLKTIQTATNREMEKEIVLNPYNKLPLGNEKEWTRITLRERNRQKMLHAVWFYLHDLLEKAKLLRQKSIDDCKGLVLGGGDRLQGNLGGNENIRYINCSGHYTIGYLCQNSSNCTSWKGEFYCV